MRMTAGMDFAVLAFFPADHGAVVGGKLYVNGGYWSKLNFPNYPQVVTVSLVAVIHVPFRAYQQDHVFEIGLEDAGGNVLDFKVEGGFRVGADPETRYGEPSVMPIAATVNVQIERPTDYAFTLKLDGHEEARYAFRAVQVAVPVKFEVPPEQPPAPDAEL